MSGARIDAARQTYREQSFAITRGESRRREVVVPEHCLADDVEPISHGHNVRVCRSRYCEGA